MSTITWLHISDLHWRESRSYDANIVVQALLRDLADRTEISPSLAKIDLIFVTGDIAFAGKKAEYVLASHFFGELLRTTRTRKTRLFTVPGNHDVDRSAITDASRAVVDGIEDRQGINDVLGNEVQRATVMQRVPGYRWFVSDYFGRNLRFDGANYFYAKERSVAGRRVAILGLNSSWASASDADRHKLFLGERQVRAALREARRADIRIVLMHHPFDWLQDTDRDTCEPMVLRECDFVLHGHLHRTGITSLQSPGSSTTVIGAGACYETPTYAYNLVHLDLNSGQGTIYLRTYSGQEGGFWTEDRMTYRDAPGKYTFDLSSRWIAARGSGSVQERSGEARGARQTGGSSRLTISRLRSWLSRRGLREHPFAVSNARMEEKEDLSGCFVDVHDWFDELADTRTLCVLFAARGCGKTAYRKMLAAQCWPIDPQSDTLAVQCTYDNLVRVLRTAGNNMAGVQTSHFVAELLNQAISAIRAGAREDTEIRAALARPEIGQQLAACEGFVSRFVAGSTGREVTEPWVTTNDEVLSNFTRLARALRFKSCIVLVDEVADLWQTIGDPRRQVALLAPLLGVPVMQRPDLAFKFFLPLEIKPELEAQRWYRPDTLRIFAIDWDVPTLQKLIRQRLSYHSSREPPYEALAQLCEDDLAASIDHELICLAEGRPRWVTMLADALFWAHCRRDGRLAQIAQATWEAAKAEWLARRVELLRNDQFPRIGPPEVGPSRAKLHQLLIGRFDEGELRTLCFYLNVDYDILRDQGKEGKARELILHLEHRGQIDRLIDEGRRLRLDIDWDSIA